MPIESLIFPSIAKSFFEKKVRGCKYISAECPVVRFSHTANPSAQTNNSPISKLCTETIGQFKENCSLVFFKVIKVGPFGIAQNLLSVNWVFTLNQP